MEGQQGMLEPHQQDGGVVGGELLEQQRLLNQSMLKVVTNNIQCRKVITFVLTFGGYSFRTSVTNIMIFIKALYASASTVCVNTER